MARLIEKMREIWGKIKNQPLDVWFFYLFLLTFTLSVRKVMLFFPLKGTFNEYAGIYVYASDIFLYLTILLWLAPILYNKILNLSMSSEGASELIHKENCVETVDNSFSHKLSTDKFAYFKAFIAKIGKLFHPSNLENVPPASPAGRRGTFSDYGAGVEHFRSTGQAWNSLSELSIFLTPLVFVIWAFISVFWSENQTISTYRSMRLFEICFLYIYIIVRFVPYCWEYFSKCSTCLPDRQAWNILDKKSSENVPPRKTHNCSTWNNSSVNQSVNVPPTYAKAPAGRRVTFMQLFFGIIVFSGLLQSIIGIWQFVIQHSVGLFFLKESQISPILPGVAKIILNSQVFIRAYGLMPHPNILGGFLVFSIILTLLWKKMFHPSGNRIVPRGTISNCRVGVEHSIYSKCSTWNIFSCIWSKKVFNLIIAIQLLALFLTFSKSAIIGLILALFYIYYPCLTKCRKMFHPNNLENVSSQGALNCSTCLPDRQAWNNLKYRDRREIFSDHGTGVEQFNRLSVYIVGTLLILVAIFVFVKPNFQSLFTKSLSERLFYLNVSRGTILDNSLIGVGNGQFVLSIEKYAQSYLEIWQYQPVHNVFLLIWSELGVIGLVLLILWIWKLFHLPTPRLQQASVEQFENNEVGEQSILCNNNDELSMFQIQRYFKGILLAFLFIMLFDHYLWDIWQGQVMFWMMAGFVAGASRKVLK